MMRQFSALALVIGFGSMVAAGPFGVFGRRGGSYYPAQGNVAQSNSGGLWTAQQAAEFQASRCQMGHFGNPSGGFEGVGRAMSAAAALANTCKPHNGPPRDWGVAQGRDGFFYACRRW